MLKQSFPCQARAAAAPAARRRHDSRLEQLQAASDRLDQLIAAETLGCTSQRQYDANADQARTIGRDLDAVYRARPTF